MRPRAISAALLALSLLATAPGPASAQPKPAPAASASASAPAAPEEVAPDSPRASVKRYLELCRAGEYAEAAGYLDLPEALKPDGPLLARRLKAVLDRRIWVKVDDLSPASHGKRSDQLPADVEEIGSIPGPNGPEPVRLVRRRSPEGMRWIFSQNTVEHIDAWHGRLRDHWLEDHFPERLLRTGPQELRWWQWIALPVLFVLALGAGNVLGYVTRLGISRVVARLNGKVDDALLARLGAPLTLAWALTAVQLAVPRLALYPPAQDFIERILRAGFFVAFFWFVIRSIDVGGSRVLELPNAKANPAARSLVPLGAKALKVVVVAIAFIAVLSELGFAVGSLLAGLGIGGVALALAAQKTVENLFGSLSIGVDQPFAVGDFITVDGVSGVVESIGLRSTRLRTLDRTQVTFPNGKLADMRIESFAPRDRIRFVCTLPLAPGTRPAEVQQVLAAIRAYFEKTAKVWPDRSIALARITDASLDVDVMVWFETTSWDEFVKLREEALLALLDLVEGSGVKLAAAATRLLPPGDAAARKPG
jgi:MscS family membrane protein